MDAHESRSQWTKQGKWLSYVGGIVGCLALLIVFGAGLGNRLGWWDFRPALMILRWAAWVGLGAAFLAAIGMAIGHGARHALAIGACGLIAGAILFGVPWWYQQQRPKGSPINDITTDTANPPQFVAVAPIRERATNPLQYGGPKVAELQKAAYPDIAPAMLPTDESNAFNRALRAAESMGWEIIVAAPAEGRIEAVDTTRFFGFKDDIVIRVTAVADASRVDVRSHSRVGRSDFGTNARRVRAFLKQLSAA
jgi:uncharacterized protein (DUF1499 family)